MRTQVNTSDGIQVWRECPTCRDLISRHFSHFADCDNILWLNCVDEMLSKGQTPEELLLYLDNK